MNSYLFNVNKANDEQLKSGVKNYDQIANTRI